MGTKHRDFSNASLHRVGVWSDEDPAVTYGTGETGVHAGLLWIEHASGDPDNIVAIKQRNDANDDWVEWPAPTHTHTGDEVRVSETEQTGTSYTLALSDAGKMVKLTNAAAITLSIPTNAAVAFPIGTGILIRQGGAGAVTVVADSGADVVSEGDAFLTAGLDAVAGLLKVATDSWILFGNVVVS